MTATRILAAWAVVLCLFAAPAARAQVATSFTVSGDVLRPATIDLAALEALPRAQANVTYAPGGRVVRTDAFTGALLWDLLQSVGIALDSAIDNDILHKVIVVTGSDGYQAVFGAGELDPRFGGDQVIIAYRKNGRLIRRHGFAQIVAPGDKTDGRFVFSIARIEVRDAAK
jgi:DMSO/TMAO reductase YedYZ molybdopterin-dependent catalytic subunit